MSQSDPIEPIDVIQFRDVYRSSFGGKGFSSWKTWDPYRPFLPDQKHSLLGLTTYMKTYPDDWKAEWLVKANTVDSRIFNYSATTQFRVPMILRRTAMMAPTDGSSGWNVFAAADAPIDYPTSNGLRLWMATNRGYGWDPKILAPWDGTGLHLYIYKTDQSETHFWIPDVRDVFVVETSPLMTLTAVCVNALGCATLTVGNEYELRSGSELGLVLVTDDVGTEREFLRERFGFATSHPISIPESHQ